MGMPIHLAILPPYICEVLFPHMCELCLYLLACISFNHLVCVSCALCLFARASFHHLAYMSCVCPSFNVRILITSHVGVAPTPWVVLVLVSLRYQPLSWATNKKGTRQGAKKTRDY